MKHFSFLFLLIFASITFTGCFDIIEEIFLNKDGSGKYITTIDLSGAPAALESMIKQEGGNESTDDNKTFEKIDSIITFDELIAEQTAEEKASIERLEFWQEKFHVRMNMDEETKKMMIHFVLKFDSFEDINYYANNFGKIIETAAGDQGDNNMSSKIAELTTASYLTMKGKKKLIQTTEKFDAETVLGEGADQMIKMIAGEGTIKTIFHVEQGVKKAKNKNSVIADDGKTVTTTFPLMDYLSGNVDMNNQLKLK